MSTSPHVAALALAAAITGQQPSPEQHLSEGLRVPVHRAPHDAQSPDDALWASGATYKVAFGDGYTFYPVLGPNAPANLPVRWRTRSVTVGGVEITDLDNRARRHSAWRYELVADGLVEAYDVLADGVEQTFVLTEPPATRGDLVVRGEVETALDCDDRAPCHAAIGFCDPTGRSLVSYGEAFVLDASGRSLEVASAVEHGTIVLTVPGDWLAAANYPVILDPLTLGTALATAAGNTATSSTAIGTESDSGSSNVMLVFSRAVSAGDHDIYAVLMDNDFGNRRTIYSDLSNENSDFDAQVAYVAGADRWLIGMQRDYLRSGAIVSTVRTYYHDRGNLSLNSGIAFSIQNIGSEQFRAPAFGGTSTGSGIYGVLAYQRELASGNTLNSDVVVVPIRATTTQYLSAYFAGNEPSGTSYDRENPTVTPVSEDGQDGWLVAWGEVRRSGGIGIPDDWDIYGLRTTFEAKKSGSPVLLASSGARHSRRPQLAGRAEVYMLAWEQSESLAATATTEISARRIAWSVRAPTPTLGPVRTVTTWSPLGGLKLESMAHDSRTRSHWAVTYTRLSGARRAYITRLGATGNATETATLWSSSSRGAVATSVAYDSREASFSAVYGVASTQRPYHPIYGTHFVYPATAQAVAYGKACGLARISSSPPYTGHSNFSMSIRDAPAGTAATLMVSVGSASIPLELFGLRDCTLLVDPTAMLNLPVVTDGRGGASAGLPLPDKPPFRGDLYAQWVYFAIGANPLNLALTPGLRIEVR